MECHWNVSRYFWHHRLLGRSTLPNSRKVLELTKALGSELHPVSKLFFRWIPLTLRVFWLYLNTDKHWWHHRRKPPPPPPMMAASLQCPPRGAFKHSRKVHISRKVLESKLQSTSSFFAVNATTSKRFVGILIKHRGGGGVGGVTHSCNCSSWLHILRKGRSR